MGLHAHRFEPEPVDYQALLSPHSHRKLRILVQSAPGQGGIVDALWDFLYRDAANVSHQTAVQVAKELEGSDMTVGDVLAGWKPEALR